MAIEKVYDDYLRSMEQKPRATLRGEDIPPEAMRVNTRTYGWGWAWLCDPEVCRHRENGRPRNDVHYYRWHFVNDARDRMRHWNDSILIYRVTA